MLESPEAASLKVTWKDCGTSGTHGTVTSFSPDSMTMGAETTMTGHGSVNEQVTGGTFDMTMKAGFITQHFNGDVCTAKTFDLPLGLGSIKWPGMGCPVAKGDTTISMDVNLSSSIPSMMRDATITLNAKDQNGQPLLCMEVMTKT